ncbi:MAG: hypothetical protein ABWY25_06325 [Paenisporosarcina sp.]
MRMQFKEWVIPAAVGVTSFAVGAVVGHLWTKYKFKMEVDEELLTYEKLDEHVNQLQFQFDQNSDKMNSLIQQASHVVGRFKEDGQSFLDKFAAPHVEKAKDVHPSNEKRRTTLAQLPTHDDQLTVNVFTEEDDDWNYDWEVKHRDELHPYVIHRDEYFSNEEDYSQSSLMYYNGDNILCDEHDVPVYNPDKVVGKLLFGHGSRDPNIVYIRNDQLQAEYEVLFDPGFFQEEVLGEQIEGGLKHSRGVPKFRDE